MFCVSADQTQADGWNMNSLTRIAPLYNSYHLSCFRPHQNILEYRFCGAKLEVKSLIKNILSESFLLLPALSRYSDGLRAGRPGFDSRQRQVIFP
jgi:hypothetical protein